MDDLDFVSILRNEQFLHELALPDGIFVDYDNEDDMRRLGVDLCRRVTVRRGSRMVSVIIGVPGLFVLGRCVISIARSDDYGKTFHELASFVKFEEAGMIVEGSFE